MSLQPVSPEQVAVALRLGSSTDAPAWGGLAALARLTVARWGACRRMEVKAQLVECCVAAGFDPEVSAARVEEVLVRLAELGDLELAVVGPRDDPEPADPSAEGADPAPPPARPGHYLLPTRPRLVECGDVGLVCGAQPLAEERLGGKLLAPQEAEAALCRWVSLSATEGRPEDLERARVPLVRWLGVPAHRRCSARLVTLLGDATPLRWDEPLEELWQHAKRALDPAGRPVRDQASLVLIGGRPGARFGAPGERGGRWLPAAQVADGVWCGARCAVGRRGSPLVAEVASGEVLRALDLYDWDELYWVQLGRGLAEGARERLILRGAELEVQAPLPAQLRRLGALAQRAAWCWRLPTERAARAVADALSALGGLEVVEPR